jgi:hypothetical protein
VTTQQLKTIEHGQDVVASNVDPMVSMIERVALNPQIPIERLESLLAMKERLEDRAREAEEREQIRAYHRAKSACQAELTVVTKNKKNEHTKSKYADLAAISKSADPVIHKHGFSVSFSPAGTNEKGEQQIKWTIAHCDGHIESDIASVPADKTGTKDTVNKTDIHAFGSAATYGRRYLKLMLFDIATGDDDDGNAAGGIQFITEKQIDELIAMAEEAEADKPAFCKALGFDSFNTIPATHFFKAKSWLQAKMLKKQKEEAQ